jgi:hypothetical protein
MGVALFWIVVGTSLLVGAVWSVAGRRRRRQQLIRLYENQASLDDARTASSRAIVHHFSIGGG